MFAKCNNETHTLCAYKVETCEIQFYFATNNANDHIDSNRYQGISCIDKIRGSAILVCGENESGECYFMYLFEVRIYDTAEVSSEVDKRGSDKWMNEPPLFCEMQNRGANIRARSIPIFSKHDKYTTRPNLKSKFDEL